MIVHFNALISADYFYAFIIQMAPRCHAKAPELNLLLVMCVPPSWSATPASFERQMKRHPGILLPKGNRKTSVRRNGTAGPKQAPPAALL